MTSNLPRSIPLSQIDPNPVGIQPRAQLNQDAVERYADDLREGNEQPAIHLIEIKGQSKFRIEDGYHRYAAHEIVKRKQIRAVVTKGTMIQAAESALEYNTRHGVPLSSNERRLALMSLLDEYAFQGIERSLGELARITGIPKSTVGRIVKERAADTDRMAGLPENPPTEKPAKTPTTITEDDSNRPNGTLIHNEPDEDVDELKGREAAGEIVLHDSKIMIGEVARMLNQAKGRIGEIVEQPGCQAIARHQSQLERGIADIVGIVRACTPTVVCQKCDGKGEQCPVCKGVRVLCAEQAKQQEQDGKTGLRKRGSAEKPSEQAGGSHW